MTIVLVFDLYLNVIEQGKSVSVFYVILQVSEISSYYYATLDPDAGLAVIAPSPLCAGN